MKRHFAIAAFVTLAAQPAIACGGPCDPEPPAVKPPTSSGGGNSSSDLGNALLIILGGCIILEATTDQSCLPQRGGNNPEITDQSYRGGKLGEPTLADGS